MVNYRKSSRKTRGHKRGSTRRSASTTRRLRRSHSHRRRRVIQSGG